SDSAANAFAALIPLLTSASGASSQDSPVGDKPSRYLVVKGLPTIPMKLAEKFLPAPRVLRLAELSPKASSLQDSLVGALSHFQALQQH
ncbi:hypothetical protein GBAR_LOCUS13493, partial [Geodia barretti]